MPDHTGSVTAGRSPSSRQCGPHLTPEQRGCCCAARLQPEAMATRASFSKSRLDAAGHTVAGPSFVDLPAPSVIPAAWPRHAVRATDSQRASGRRCCCVRPFQAARDLPLDAWLSGGLLVTTLCLALVPTNHPYLSTTTFGADVAAWLDEAIAAQDRGGAAMTELVGSFNRATRATRLAFAASAFGIVSQVAVVAYLLCGSDQSARRSKSR